MAFAGFVTAMFITLLMIPPLMQSAQRLQLVDMPNARKVHARVIPRIGGIAMVLGVMIPCWLWLQWQPWLIAFLCAVLVLAVVGAWDDRAELSWKTKLLGQVVASVILVVGGHLYLDHIPFLDLQTLPAWAGIPVSILALTGITNALNLVDGLDGLAAGTMLLTFGAIALLAYHGGDAQLLVLSVTIMGSIIGFLRFNTHPARIFMGDCGSQFLGFSAGAFCIELTQHTDPALSPMVPLILLGLPILDTFMVMSERLREGLSPFLPDKRHIHHKLMKIGLSHHQVVFVLYLLQSLLTVVAYLGRYESDIGLGLFFTGFAFCTIALLHYGDREQEIPVARRLLKLLNGDYKKRFRWAHVPMPLAIMGLLAVLALFSPLANLQLPLGVSGFFVGCGVVLLLIRGREGVLYWVRKAAFYVSFSLLTYLTTRILSHHQGLHWVFNGIYFLLLIMMLISLQFRRQETETEFALTPSDYLVLFVAIMGAWWGGLGDGPFSPGSLMIRLIIVFYALEFVLEQPVPKALRRVAAQHWLGAYMFLLGVWSIYISGGFGVLRTL